MLLVQELVDAVAGCDPRGAVGRRREDARVVVVGRDLSRTLSRRSSLTLPPIFCVSADVCVALIGSHPYVDELGQK